MDAAEILQRLHDSEINWSLSAFYDSTFRWALGDELNGVTTEGRARTVTAAVLALAENAFAENPGSVFAGWWKEQRAAREV
jgi:hypothetical protein